jgi:signal peptidase I
MSKHKPPIVSKRPVQAPATSFLARHIPTAPAIRETIESIAIAFVFAFLIRTFEAEAFVIPTGSMAPTLMGRHKDLKCEKCGYPYQVNDSEKLDGNGQFIKSAGITRCTCPMCRYTMEVNDKNQPPYSGDRIIVNKFSYQFEEPKRWDVIVFYFPGRASDNYIKRLAGLPGETLRVHLGDVWTRNDTVNPADDDGTGEFKIARKPPEKLLAMLQPVFDNDYMPDIARYGWPARWQADSISNKPAGDWTSEDDSTYQTDGDATADVWLRYHHLVPSYTQWNSRNPSARGSLKAQLITDFTAYNTGRSSESSLESEFASLGMHWVGDLAFSTVLETENNSGEVVLELIKGGRKFQCRLDVATGLAELSIDGDDMQAFHPKAQTYFRGPGKHTVMFSNCDRQLLLWVDGKVAEFDSTTEYDDLGNSRPNVLDLAPVGIASRGVKMKASHLKVLRDIYYIADNKAGLLGMLVDYITDPPLLLEGKVEQFFSDHTQWKYFDEANMGKIDFPLKADQFFALGDNSARSQDSRLWEKNDWSNAEHPPYCIDRELLKGRALFIYWPHSWHKIPYVNIPFPFFPNFSRMHLIK